MQKRYYHPSIREFRIGFEYEVLTGTSSWSKLKMLHLDWPTDYTLDLQDGKIRVRVLDPEFLIKERGYTLIHSSDKFTTLTKGIFKLTLENQTAVSWFYHVKITNLSFGDDEVVYSGMIRNGSEFDYIIQLILGIEV